MKKAFIALLAIGVLVGAVLVGWELVAKPGPLRKVWRSMRGRDMQVYEARYQFNLTVPMNDEQLAAENRLLDSQDILMPVVQELKLAEKWQLAGDWAAIERLAANSELRRGDTELILILAARDPEQETAGQLIEPLVRLYVEQKRKQAAAGVQ